MTRVTRSLFHGTHERETEGQAKQRKRRTHHHKILYSLRRQGLRKSGHKTSSRHACSFSLILSFFSAPIHRDAWSGGGRRRRHRRRVSSQQSIHRSRRSPAQGIQADCRLTSVRQSITTPVIDGRNRVITRWRLSITSR